MSVKQSTWKVLKLSGTLKLKLNLLRTTEEFFKRVAKSHGFSAASIYLFGCIPLSAQLLLTTSLSFIAHCSHAPILESARDAYVIRYFMCSYVRCSLICEARAYRWLHHCRRMTTLLNFVAIYEHFCLLVAPCASLQSLSPFQRNRGHSPECANQSHSI